MALCRPRNREVDPDQMGLFCLHKSFRLDRLIATRFGSWDQQYKLQDYPVTDWLLNTNLSMALAEFGN